MPSITHRDTVTITQGNRIRKGTVISANNFGGYMTDPNWYVEMMCFEDTYSPSQVGAYYVYWKQAIDGGQVVFHDVTIDPTQSDGKYKCECGVSFNTRKDASIHENLTAHRMR